MNVMKRICEYVFPRMDARCRIRVFMCLISSAYASTFATTILPEMILELGYNEEDKGYYSGLTLSVFNLGLWIGGFVWGYMWDKNVGQRTLMVTGLLANATLCLSFGFCKNIFTLLVVRLMIGVTIGMTVAIKAFLYDNSDNSTHAANMSFYSFSYYFGQIIGWTLPGCLSSHSVVSTYTCTFLRNYPYFLAGFVGFCISLLTALVLLCPYSEQVRANRYIEISSSSNDNGDNVETMNCVSGKTQDDYLDNTNNINNCEKPEDNILQPHSGCTASLKNTVHKYIVNSVFITSLKSYDVLLTLVASALFYFSNSGFKCVFVVWLSTNYDIGGLGLETYEISLIFGLISVIGTINVILLPLCERKFGAIQLYSMLIMVSFVIVNMLPICRLIKSSHHTWMVVSLIIVMTICKSMSYGLNSIIVNNSAPIDSVGTVNGLSELLGDAGKTVAPVD